MSTMQDKLAALATMLRYPAVTDERLRSIIANPGTGYSGCSAAETVKTAKMVLEEREAAAPPKPGFMGFDPQGMSTTDLQSLLSVPGTDRTTAKLCAITLGARGEPLHPGILPGCPERSPDCVTLINAPDNCPQTKDWTKLDTKGRPQPAGYRASKWKFFEVRLNNLREFHQFLSVASLNPFNAITRGALLEGLDPTGWHDRICDSNTDARNPDGSRKSVTVADKPNRLLCVEIDVAVSDPLEYQPQLPNWLRGIAHVVQLSSSAGHASAGGKVKAHLWYWLDKPVNSVEARALLKNTIADTKPIQPVGIHFIASPITGETPDPFEGKRIWLEDGSRVGQTWPQVVIVPEILASEAPQRAMKGLGNGPVAPASHGTTFVHTDGHTYYTDEYVASLKPPEPVLQWVLDGAATFVKQQAAVENPVTKTHKLDLQNQTAQTVEVEDGWSKHSLDAGLAIGPLSRWGYGKTVEQWADEFNKAGQEHG